MRRGILLIAVILFSAGVKAQSQSPRRVLSYEDAIKLALRNGILLNQQKNNLDVNQIQKLSNIAGLGPTLSANGSANRIDGNFFNQQAGKLSQGLFDQVTGSVNANLNIFSGFSQVNRARQSSSLLDAQAYYVNRTTEDLINSVSSQYLLVLLDEEFLRIANENFTVLQKQLGQITEQVNLGAKSPVDQYNQDSQAKAAEIRALQAELNLLNDRALLSQTLLLDPSDEFDVVKPEWDPNTVAAGITELPVMTDAALKNRGDYLRAVKNEEGAKYGMYAMKGAMMPSLGAYYSVYSAYNHQHGSVTEGFHSQVTTTNLRKYYGLQLNIPIFGGNQTFQYRTNYIQQKVLYQNNQILRKNAEIQVRTDVQKAYKTFDLLKRTYAATIAQLASSEIAFKYESERYNLGVTDFVTYLNANRVLVQAQTDKAQAEYRLVFQKIVLEYAMGTLKPEVTP